MVRNALAEMLIRYRAIEFGDFTLASGAKSPYYIDVKSAVTHPNLLRQSLKPSPPRTNLT